MGPQAYIFISCNCYTARQQSTLHGIMLPNWRGRLILRVCRKVNTLKLNPHTIFTLYFPPTNAESESLAMSSHPPMLSEGGIL